MRTKCGSSRRNNKQLRQNEEILAKDLIKHEAISKETLKAMEKLLSRSDEEKKVIIKTYEERMNMTEDRSRIGFEVKEQAMQDMIAVLKDEINQLSAENRVLKDAKIANSEIALENKRLKEEVGNLKGLVKQKDALREQEKSMIKQQINEMREELVHLRENANINNISIKEETVSLREELVDKDAELRLLRKKLEDIQANNENSSKTSFSMINNLEQKLSFYIEENAILKANFETSRGECQILRRQLDDQRQYYEEKIQRRDDHRRKKKQEWQRTYSKLKEENDYLRGNSYAGDHSMNPGINAEQILNEFLKRNSSQAAYQGEKNS